MKPTATHDSLHLHEAGHATVLFLRPDLASVWHPSGVKIEIRDGRHAGAVFSGNEASVDLFGPDTIPTERGPEVLFAETVPECTPALLTFLAAGRACELELAAAGDGFADTVSFNMSSDGRKIAAVLTRLLDSSAGFSLSRDIFLHEARADVLQRTRDLFMQSKVAHATSSLATALHDTPCLPWARVCEILSANIDTARGEILARSVNVLGEGPLAGTESRIVVDNAPSIAIENQGAVSEQQTNEKVGMTTNARE